MLEPSCAAALRRDLTELLPADARAASVARRVTTLAELLDGAGWAPPPRSPAGRPERALVQPHCHQQAILGTAADRRLMAAAGIEPTAVLSGCCGLAGNFGAEAATSASRARLRSWSCCRPSGRPDAETLVLADGFSCRTQIEFLDGRRARHLAEVLAARLDDDAAGVDGAARDR